MSRRDDVDLTHLKLEPLLEKKELAFYLGWSERWIDKKIHDGLPYHPVGNRKRFDRVEVLKWLESHRGDESDAA